MKFKRIILILIQLFIVVGLFVGVNAHSNSIIQPERVLVWSENVNANAEADQDKFYEWKEVPRDAVTNSMVTNLEVLVGQYTAVDVFAGDYVTVNQFTDEEALQVFDDKSPADLRRMSVDATIISTLGNTLEPGNRVDLISVIELRREEDPVVTETFLTDISVMSVKDNTGNPVSGDGAQVGRPALITLAVTPEQAEIISEMEGLGDIRVIGRF